MDKCKCDCICIQKKGKKNRKLDTFKYKGHPLLESKIKYSKYAVARRFWATPDTLVELCAIQVDKEPLPEAFYWSCEEVAKWVESLGFGHYAQAFIENGIDGRRLTIIEASALPKMNIQNFQDIQKITAAIRDLYKIEFVLYNRSISLPPRYPGTHYKFYRVCTGPKYELCRQSDLYRKMKLVRDAPTNDNHWVLLEKWLQHHPNYQMERVGYAPRYDLYQRRYFMCYDNMKEDIKEDFRYCICPAMYPQPKCYSLRDILSDEGLLKKEQQFAIL